MISRLSLTLAVCLSAYGCGQTPPPCPHDNNQLPAASAGCMLVKNGRLLVVQDFKSYISVPGGSSDKKESPQCTAHRETWEETGLNVYVGELVDKFDTGFHLYKCSLSNPRGMIDPPPRLELQDVFWLAVDEFPNHTWRYPYQQRLFTQWMLEKSQTTNSKAIE